MCGGERRCLHLGGRRSCSRCRAQVSRWVPRLVGFMMRLTVLHVVLSLDTNLDSYLSIAQAWWMVCPFADVGGRLKLLSCGESATPVSSPRDTLFLFIEKVIKISHHITIYSSKIFTTG